MRNVNYPLLNLDVLRVHAEDSAFLVGLLDKALEAPHYRLIDIYDLENRIQGHLDALARAGEAGDGLSLEGLADSPGFGEVFAAFHLGLTGGRKRTLTRALDAVEDDPARLAGAARGAAWCPAEVLSGHMSGWIASADARLVWIALDTCGAHRIDPRAHLDRAIGHDDARVRARAWRVAGECGRADLVDAACDQLADGGGAGFEAAWAATLLGDREAAPQALAARLRDGLAPAQSRRAAELAPLGLDAADAQALVRALLGSGQGRRWGVVALATLGRAESLEWLVGKMEDPLLGRIAGAAFSQITGAHMGLDELELDEFPDDPENPSVDADGTEGFIESGLAWPEPERVTRWLEQNEHRFAPDTRLLFGTAAWTQPDPPEPVLPYQAAFRAVAHEIALRSPTARLPNWRARVALTDRAFTRMW